MLEFVLRNAEERNGHDDNYYEHMLADSITETLKMGCPEAGLQESQVYGHISYNINAPTRELLDEALILVDKSIGLWLTVFNIDKMVNKYR